MEAEDRAVEGEEMVEESVSFSVEAQLFMSAIFVVARLWVSRRTAVRKYAHGGEKVCSRECENLRTEVRILSHGCATSFAHMW